MRARPPARRGGEGDDGSEHGNRRAIVAAERPAAAIAARQDSATPIRGAGAGGQETGHSFAARTDAAVSGKVLQIAAVSAARTRGETLEPRLGDVAVRDLGQEGHTARFGERDRQIGVGFGHKLTTIS